MELERAWCAETSSDPMLWSSSNPAWGQCAVTALVVQDKFGGALQRVQIGQWGHYFNVFDWGFADLTGKQFQHLPKELTLTGEPEDRTRDYVLSFPATARRYELLKERMSWDS